MPYRTNRFLKTLPGVLLIVVILALMSSVGYIVYDTLQHETSRGIVIVTALLSGGLIATDAEGNESVIWDPIPIDEFPIHEVLGVDGSLNIQIALEEVANAYTASGEYMLGSLLSIFDNLAVDAVTGKSVLNVRPANMSDDTHAKYGVMNVYKETFDMLSDRYGDKAEVSVFNYDWRLDNRDNAALLEQFIDEKGYDEVVLTSHSMGGNVVAGYLARSAENREKVKLYCAYAPSLLGSVDALPVPDFRHAGRFRSGYSAGICRKRGCRRRRSAAALDAIDRTAAAQPLSDDLGSVLRGFSHDYR